MSDDPDDDDAWRLLLAGGPLDGLIITWNGDQLPDDIALRFRWPDFECLYQSSSGMTIEIKIEENGESNPVHRYTYVPTKKPDRGVKSQ